MLTLKGKFVPFAGGAAPAGNRSFRSMMPGVFSPSRIDLYPHQLWVCRKVTEQWPARWVVADDVGLGKTIEAGLILWRLFHLGLVRRLLILCPASLVQQWQERLFTMFDIRTAQYNPEQDSGRVDFWKLNPFVVASFHTLACGPGATA